MRVSVTLSANAGVALNLNGRRIWVDALHTRKEKGFSTLTPELLQQMQRHPAFAAPEYICYTHTHPDHYSGSLTDAAVKLWNGSVCQVPEARWQDVHNIISDDLMLRFVKLPHEGPQYADVLHYGMVVSYRGRNILIPGDCEVANEILLQAVGDTPIHLLLLDFPWLTLRRGAKFLREHFAEIPKIVYHLPFAEDDTMGYRAVTKRRLTEFPEAQMLCDPLQTIELEI